MRWRAASTAAALGLAASGAIAAPFDPGAPEGAVPTARVARDFDSYALPSGPATTGGLKAIALEGAVTWAAFRLDAPPVSTAAIIAGYRARLEAAGFRTIFTCATEACGGFDFRFAAAVMPAPGMRMDVADFAQLSATRAEPEAHVSVLVSRALDRVYVQTVSVTPASPDLEVGDAPARDTASETAITAIEERALYQRLITNGHVPVDGLSFAAGGADLTGRSAEALELLSRLLKRHAGLAVVIVGHSDNVGGLDANIALSQRRAEAVLTALIARGVSPERLSARGIGYLAPRTSNTSEDGRATNRRVELVVR